MADPIPAVLDATRRAKLLDTARRSLERHLSRQQPLEIATDDEALLRPAGVFVTLHLIGEGEPRLRGCIGTFEAEQPLLHAVARMAVTAATSDPRFAPVAASELDRLRIEISVLSPRRAVTHDEVEIGTHGLFVTRDGLRGVLLPQVAVEMGWDSETFLAHTCQKAGLPRDAWRDPKTTLEVFMAEVFAEPLRAG